MEEKGNIVGKVKVAQVDISNQERPLKIRVAKKII